MQKHFLALTFVALLLAHELMHIFLLALLGYPVWGLKFGIVAHNAAQTPHLFAVFHPHLSPIALIVVYLSPLVLVPLTVWLTDDSRIWIMVLLSYSDVLSVGGYFL